MDFLASWRLTILSFYAVDGTYDDDGKMKNAANLRSFEKFSEIFKIII